MEPISISRPSSLRITLQPLRLREPERGQAFLSVTELPRSAAAASKGPLRVMNDKTRGEHNASAYRRIASKSPSAAAPLSLTGEP